MDRVILHLDLDAFYPSVEALDDPSLVGKPVIVGGLGNRGVVASASYEARRYGVHSALPMARARRLCPDGIYIRPRFQRYRELSRQVFAIYRDASDLVEPLSLDEAYIDVTRRDEPGVRVARRLKTHVAESTGLTVSAGVGPNKFLAKLASDYDKPDGLTVIESRGAAAFIAPLSVDRLWGVGPASAARLRDAGVATIGDVAAADPNSLVRLLGKTGARIHELAHGVDDRAVHPPGPPKSISAETTFDQDLWSWRQAGPAVHRFSERLAGSLERHRMAARTVVLKVRFRDFRTITRSRTGSSPVRTEHEILAVARELARGVPVGATQGLRLVGLGLQNLVAEDDLAVENATDATVDEQIPLFDADPPRR